MSDQIISSVKEVCTIFLFVGSFSIGFFNILPSLLFNCSNIQPIDLFIHDSLNTTENFIHDSILFDFSSKNDIIKFIAVNFLDYFFKLKTESIGLYYYETINNEGLYKLFKGVFGNKNTCLKSINLITDTYFKGQLLDFFYKLNECNSFEEFKLIHKNKKIICHLLKYIKSEYLL